MGVTLGRLGGGCGAMDAVAAHVELVFVGLGEFRREDLGVVVGAVGVGPLEDLFPEFGVEFVVDELGFEAGAAAVDEEDRWRGFQVVAGLEAAGVGLALDASGPIRDNLRTWRDSVSHLGFRPLRLRS